MNALHRIRTTVSSYRGTLLLLIGLVLLLNPQLTAGLAGTESDQYSYESFQITLNEDGTIDNPRGGMALDSDAACLGPPWSRTCVLERATHASGGLVYDGPSSTFVHTAYAHVYIPGEGFFDPVERELANGSVRYGHDPVDTRTAMEQISTPIEQASAGVREAIQQGSLDTNEALHDTNELIEADDGYYVVTRTGYDAAPEGWSWVPLVVRWLPGIVGLTLVIVGHYLQIATDVTRVRERYRRSN